MRRLLTAAGAILMLALAALAADVNVLITSVANSDHLDLRYYRDDASGTNVTGSVSPTVLPQLISLTWTAKTNCYYVVRRSFTLDVHPYIEPSTGRTNGYYGAWEVISPHLTNGSFSFGEGEPIGMFYRVQEFSK